MIPATQVDPSWWERASARPPLTWRCSGRCQRERAPGPALRGGALASVSTAGFVPLCPAGGRRPRGRPASLPKRKHARRHLKVARQYANLLPGQVECPGQHCR